MASIKPEELKIDSQIDNKLLDISDNLDLQQAPPIHQKRLVTFFNHFIISMVDYLNSFSQSCSYKLFKFEEKISKIEAELRLVESKLNSVPELTIEKNQSSTPINTQKTTEVNSTTSQQPSPSVQPEAAEEEETKEDHDPVVIKYMKMVQFGVPVEAVKVKMRLEGVDPSLLKL
ncbi:hypothetical protein O3M35_007201 [Rhynocoris fuscipes]|uniref:WASH complex subunit 3 n=1 Tax=Rhynocoris fuscipes TaxID=488301 RepID=A0AAW1DA45_9HEMI